ncbi:hypothetical protein Tco_1255923 [Tanacetum coccineum]
MLQKSKQLKLVLNNWKPPIYYDDDDDDEESSIPLRDIISELPLSFAIAPDFPITESLIMEDEHINTIMETESDEENESSVKDLNLTPSESEDLSEDLSKDLSDYKSECDVPLCNDSSSKNEVLDDIIPDAIIESFSPSPIPVEDSDSLMEEIYIFLAPDDSIPPDDDVYFDIEPDTGVLTTKVVDDISDNSTRELYVHVPNVFLPTLYPVFDTLLPFSSKNKDKVFNPGILILKEEKSPHLLSHRGFKVFRLLRILKAR